MVKSDLMTSSDGTIRFLFFSVANQLSRPQSISPTGAPTQMTAEIPKPEADVAHLAEKTGLSL